MSLVRSTSRSHKSSISKTSRHKRIGKKRRHMLAECAAELNSLQERERYSLDDWDYGSFIPVTDIPYIRTYKGLKPSYGGAQEWWSTDDYMSTGEECGCGVIAATNLVIYLATHFSEYQALFDCSTDEITYESYMKVANEMWHEIKPYSGFAFPFEGRNPYKEDAIQPFGVTVGKLIRGVKSYARKRKIKLELQSIKAFDSCDAKAASYIKCCMEKNNPVLLLSLNNGIGKYEMHWVMITDMLNSLNHKEDEVTISTWGQQRKGIDFDELWNFGLFLDVQFLVSVTM